MPRLGSILGLAAMLLVAAKSSSADAQSPLEGAPWRVVAIDAVAVTDAGTLQLAAGRVSGKAACNRFNAKVTVSGDGFKLGPIATTRMMCPRLDLERSLLAALASVIRYEIAGQRLRLTNAAGQVRIELERG